MFTLSSQEGEDVANRENRVLVKLRKDRLGAGVLEHVATYGFS
jgi:hypothetical protein